MADGNNGLHSRMLSNGVLNNEGRKKMNLYKLYVKHAVCSHMKLLMN